ncbi:MAG: hypothetical protein Greene071436_398, partial [Parcubacteria group bacterium Greene0714_36]
AAILLRRTPVYDAVRRGLEKSGFPEANIIAYSESREVEGILARISHNGDCIYFSAYDWPTIYL